jgi:hypothetical protein
MANDSESIIGKVPVGKRGETLQVRTSIYKGKAYISVRRWYVDDAGQEAPGKGISIPAEIAEQVLGFFTQAVAAEVRG